MCYHWGYPLAPLCIISQTGGLRLTTNVPRWLDANRVTVLGLHAFAAALSGNVHELQASAAPEFWSDSSYMYYMYYKGLLFLHLNIFYKGLLSLHLSITRDVPPSLSSYKGVLSLHLIITRGVPPSLSSYHSLG